MRQHLLPHWDLLCPEGLAVGALVLGGVGFMGAHQDPVQRAVILGVAVIGAGLYSTFDTLVCMTIHNENLLLFGTALVWTLSKKEFRKKLSNLLFGPVCDMVINR